MRIWERFNQIAEREMLELKFTFTSKRFRWLSIPAALPYFAAHSENLLRNSWPIATLIADHKILSIFDIYQLVCIIPGYFGNFLLLRTTLRPDRLAHQLHKSPRTKKLLCRARRIDVILLVPVVCEFFLGLSRTFSLLLKFDIFLGGLWILTGLEVTQAFVWQLSRRFLLRRFRL